MRYSCGPGFGQRGKQAYELREQGRTWTEIAAELKPPSLGKEDGDPESAMTNLAKKYARTHGLPWPIKLVKAKPEPKTGPVIDLHGRQKQSYELRLLDLKWADIAEQVGYAHTPGAVAGAKKYALANGLPWRQE